MNFRLFVTTLLLVLTLFLTAQKASAQNRYIAFKKEKGSLCISSAGKSNTLYISKEDHPGVIRAFEDLQNDINKVSQALPLLITDKVPAGDEVIIAGTIGKSPLIDQLIKSKKLDVTDVAGKWETFVIQVIENPLPGVKRGLVIAGSDKRATIYGIYDVSKQIGVSPWHWWADVPAKTNTSIYALPGRFKQGEPAIKYRGIFLNDEEPALGRWAVEKYGGFNHNFYEKLFELMLRMKSNYLWPAMWWASFNSDDTLNPKLADEYGIVMGTTHHEPMNRAHAEWKAAKAGAWNYETNKVKLQEFWTEGIRRMNSYETFVSLAMRGDGDEAMSAETNTTLLEQIVKDQREIIANVTQKDVTATPQLWALYKEVQDYYDKGMRVPDDVMLLLCDDNWGNIRKLPKLNEKTHPGGYGIYYHFDYVGGPRNYKWLNTNPLPRVWEQMHLAYRYGATRMWLVNVGDLKPVEFPTEFFLDYAWDPERWNQDNLDDYTEQWVINQFGPNYSKEIAGLLANYAKFNARRKPELLNQDTYSLTNYREAETVVADYNKLEVQARRIYNTMPAAYKDAYYQLILHPVIACANLNEMYLAVAKNHRYAKQGRAATADFADSVKKLFDNDAKYSLYYNKELAGGKWNHMMDQTHISYTYWQQPRKDVLPKLDSVNLPKAADMGIAIEGSDAWWPNEPANAVLPEFDAFNKQTYYLEVFNRGEESFEYSIQSSSPWVKVNTEKGKVEKEERLFVSIDWSKVPSGKQTATLTITGPGDKKVNVGVVVNNLKNNGIKGFVESNGYISIEAVHYMNAVNTTTISWKKIPDIGRTLSGVTTFPVTASTQKPGGQSPSLAYAIHTLDSGDVELQMYISPTIDFHNEGGLKYAVSIDDEVPKIINLHTDNSNKVWEKSVADNIIIATSTHKLKTKGNHVIKFWMVDSGVVLQKIVVDRGGLKPSYLGPPESYFNK
jgi:hypothetical protein